MNGLDELLEALIFLRPGLRRPLLPDMVSHGRPTEHAGKTEDGVMRILFLNQAELHLRRSVSQANRSGGSKRELTTILPSKPIASSCGYGYQPDLRRGRDDGRGL